MMMAAIKIIKSFEMVALALASDMMAPCEKMKPQCNPLLTAGLAEYAENTVG